MPPPHADPPVVPPPGRDPVADHAWCCSHSELWRFFRPDAEARLLSALGAIFRVDPVETEFLLDLAAWAATEAALPVLRKMADSGDLAPKLQRRTALLLSRLGAEAPEGMEVRADEPEDPGALLEQLLKSESLTERRHIADRLAELVTQGRAEAHKFMIACELVGEGHPQGIGLLSPLLRGIDRSGLTDEQRSLALLTCAAAGTDEALALLAELVLTGSRPFDGDDLYEATKALVAAPPPALDMELRRTLADKLRTLMREQDDREPGRALVIRTMLLGREGRRQLWLASLRSTLLLALRSELVTRQRALAEAAGYVGTDNAVRLLRGLTRAEDRLTRTEAMRGLVRAGSPAAARAGLAALRRIVRRSGAGLDMDDATSVHAAIDLLVRTGHRRGARTLARILDRRPLQTHGIATRAALALAALGDDRCMRIDTAADVPHLIVALLSPQPVMPGRGRSAEREAFELGVRWLEAHSGASLLVPSESDEPASRHLSRVWTCRRIITWWDASQAARTPPTKAD